MDIEKNMSDIPKYKKKSQVYSPKKSDHKHLSQDCVFEWDDPLGKLTDKGFQKVHKVDGGAYCPICGQIRLGEMSFDWYKEIKGFSAFHLELSERAIKEIDPKTRTLPTFFLNDFLWKQKYVDLNNIILPKSKED